MGASALPLSDGWLTPIEMNEDQIQGILDAFAAGANLLLRASLLTFAYLAHGASVHLMEGVDAAKVLPLLSSGEISEMFAPPTVLAKLTEAAASAQIRPRLRMVLTGTASLSPSLYRRAAGLFGAVIRVTYGKSEVFNPITALEPEETAAAYAAPRDEGLCVGWPATGVRIELRDDDGVRLPHGEIGEIHIHAQHMFTGYMTRDGLRMLAPGEFHATGDLGVMDEAGRLHLVARQSDMMKTGGYKVSPDEVERALAPALPGTELVVFGYPSEYWGEIVTLIAQRPPPDWQARIAPAMAALTSYKRPRLLAAIDELPRNTIGKIVRPRLRQWLSETYDLTERPRPTLVPKSEAP
jgi:acyl-coenzyme A synthetase/AMP-(fatty) acid ligase